MDRSRLTLVTTVVNGCEHKPVARNNKSINCDLGSEALTNRVIQRYKRLGLTRSEYLRILVNNDVAQSLQTTKNNTGQKNE